MFVWKVGWVYVFMSLNFVFFVVSLFFGLFGGGYFYLSLLYFVRGCCEIVFWVFG